MELINKQKKIINELEIDKLEKQKLNDQRKM